MIQNRKKSEKHKKTFFAISRTFVLIFTCIWLLFQAHPHILTMDYWPQTCIHLTLLPFASCISLKLCSSLKDLHIISVRIRDSMTLKVSNILAEHVIYSHLSPCLCTSCFLDHLWQPLSTLTNPYSVFHTQLSWHLFHGVPFVLPWYLVLVIYANVFIPVLEWPVYPFLSFIKL